MAAYQTVEQANTLAATLPTLAAWAAADETAKGQALEQAADRIDTLRFQGRKYDPSQEREFPRRPDACGVWDLDPDTNEPIVPLKVRKAELYEANSILAGDRDEVLDKQDLGVTSESVGPFSKSYGAKPAPSTNTNETICRQARDLLRGYSLVSGRLL